VTAFEAAPLIKPPALRGVSDFQWTVLASANAGAIFLGSWLQEKVQAGDLSLSVIFLATGLPPLCTALIGWRYIREERVVTGDARKPRRQFLARLGQGASAFGRWLRGFPDRVSENRTTLLLALFIVFWKFSPSVGYIERSYLIDVRGFDATSFGVVLAVGSLTLLVSLAAYRWVVHRFPRVPWYQYLYAMVALGVLSFPLSFFLYLDPHHHWWKALFFFIPEDVELLPGWNRYIWFRLIAQTCWDLPVSRRSSSPSPSPGKPSVSTTRARDTLSSWPWPT
jgi:hypothetical protein